MFMNTPAPRLFVIAIPGGATAVPEAAPTDGPKRELAGRSFHARNRYRCLSDPGRGRGDVGGSAHREERVRTRSSFPSRGTVTSQGLDCASKYARGIDPEPDAPGGSEWLPGPAA